MARGFLYLLLLTLLTISLASIAQDGRIQLRFSATETNGKVFLDWTMNFGQTCNGIDITRSSDSLNFTSIGSILGICGSPTDTVRYSFVDESPLPNQTNHYRLSLGNLGPSQVVSIEVINLEGSSTQVRPNPITSIGQIFFSNERRRPHTLEIVSYNGQVKERLISREEFFRIDGALLNQGVHVFRILDEDSEVVSTGKLVVAK